MAQELLFSIGLAQPANKKYEPTKLYELRTAARRIFILCTLIFINSARKKKCTFA